MSDPNPLAGPAAAAKHRHAVTTHTGTSTRGGKKSVARAPGPKKFGQDPTLHPFALPNFPGRSEMHTDETVLSTPPAPPSVLDMMGSYLFGHRTPTYGADDDANDASGLTTLHRTHRVPMAASARADKMLFLQSKIAALEADPAFVPDDNSEALSIELALLKEEQHRLRVLEDPLLRSQQRELDAEIARHQEAQASLQLEIDEAMAQGSVLKLHRHDTSKTTDKTKQVARTAIEQRQATKRINSDIDEIMRLQRQETRAKAAAEALARECLVTQRMAVLKMAQEQTAKLQDDLDQATFALNRQQEAIDQAEWDEQLEPATLKEEFHPMMQSIAQSIASSPTLGNNASPRAFHGKLPTLALYDGTTDPVAWTDKAMLTLMLHDVPESKGKALVRLALTGAAEAWLAQQTRSDGPKLNNMTTTEFLAHMVTRFEDPRRSQNARQELPSIKFANFASWDLFTAAWLTVSVKINNFGDEEAAECLINALPGKIQTKVRELDPPVANAHTAMVAARNFLRAASLEHSGAQQHQTRIPQLNAVTSFPGKPSGFYGGQKSKPPSSASTKSTKTTLLKTPSLTSIALPAPLTTESRAKCVQEKLCFSCRRPGHSSVECSQDFHPV